MGVAIFGGNVNRLCYVGELLLVVCKNSNNFKLLTAYLNSHGWYCYNDAGEIYSDVIEKFSLSSDDIFVILKRD